MSAVCFIPISSRLFKVLPSGHLLGSCSQQLGKFHSSTADFSMYATMWTKRAFRIPNTGWKLYLQQFFLISISPVIVHMEQWSQDNKAEIWCFLAFQGCHFSDIGPSLTRFSLYTGKSMQNNVFPCCCFSLTSLELMKNHLMKHSLMKTAVSMRYSGKIIQASLYHVFLCKNKYFEQGS